MGSRFIERHPHEIGFSAVYEQKIQPYLKRNQGNRRDTLKMALILAVGGGVGALIIGHWLANAMAAPIITLLAVVIAIGLTLRIYSRITRGVEGEMSSFIGPILCEFLGHQTFRRHPGTSFVHAEEMESLGIIPWYNDEALTDGVEGEWKGVSYRTVEARLYRKGKRSRREVFHALLFRIDVPTNLPKIVFLRQLGDWSWIGETFSSSRRGMSKLVFPQSGLGQVYTIYTDDVAAAREQLKPEFGQMLLDISQEHMGGRQYLGAAFYGRNMYMALELRHDFLNVGSVATSMDEYPDIVRQALADLMIPRRVIDVLRRE